MPIKSLVYKKDYLTTANEKTTLEEALKTLEDSGYRCIPILDDSGTIFRGNIYKMHIHRHKSQGDDMPLPVTHLLESTTKTIKVDSPFFKVFFNIKGLPHIAALDEGNKFYGILIHNRLLSMLSDAWNLKPSSFILTVLPNNEHGNLTKMPKIISKYTNLASVITSDGNLGANDYVRRTLFTLPVGVSEETFETIAEKLEKKGYIVAEIEDLQTGTTIRENEDPDQFTL